eukprot:Skav212175  [mRNA]  locus=scaffold754:359849:361622:+ [translate_table: standard]
MWKTRCTFRLRTFQCKAHVGELASSSKDFVLELLRQGKLHVPGHVPGEVLAQASRMPSSLALITGAPFSEVAFLDAIKAVNQAVTNMTQMTQGAAMTNSMPVNPPKPQLRFCPSCGAKVLSQAHRFCAYCSMGAVEQALLANMQAGSGISYQMLLSFVGYPCMLSFAKQLSSLYQI